MIYNGINFNGSHYKNGADQVWCNWDDSSDYLFVGERHVFLISTDGIEDLSVVYRSLNNLRVNYKKDENDSVMVDLTDYIRTCIDDCSVDIELSGGLSKFQLLVSWSQRLLRDPHTFPIPPSLSDVLCIMPPSRMLATDVRDGNSLIPSGKSFFWKKKGQPSVQYKYRQKGETDWIYIKEGEEFWIGTSMYPEGVEIDDGVNVFTLELAQTECGVRYAMLYWRSLVGPHKFHSFVVKSQKTETKGDYSLLMVDNSYNTIKGSEDSLIFSIDKLNTYDFWYYSDILTSSEVKLQAIDGEMLTGFGIRLEITTNSVTVPSGYRADGKLEFEAKIKRYDAVNL